MIEKQKIKTCFIRCCRLPSCPTEVKFGAEVDINNGLLYHLSIQILSFHFNFCDIINSSVCEIQNHLYLIYLCLCVGCLRVGSESSLWQAVLYRCPVGPRLEPGSSGLAAGALAHSAISLPVLRSPLDSCRHPVLLGRIQKDHSNGGFPAWFSVFSYQQELQM